MSDSSITRRRFLKTTARLGAAAVLLPLIDSCADAPSPTATAYPKAAVGPLAMPSPMASASASATASPLAKGAALSKGANLTKVAFVITNNRAGGVTKVIDLLGINPVKGKKITLKPNFNSADPAPGSTHNDTLSSLISKLRGLGSKDIVLAERSGPPDTRTVMQQKGIFELAKKMGFDIVILNEMGADGWVHLVPKDSHWKQGFHFARPYLDAECIVETCCLKTHAYGGHFTLSLKLAVGTVGRQGFPYMNELHSSPYQRLMIAEINSVFNPALIVVDGVEAFTEGGPAVGKRVRANVVLAGVDRIAVDAVGVAILRGLGTTPEVSRGKVFQQEQIARAVELGLGVDSPAGIEIVTGDDESASYAARIRRVLDAG